MICVCRSQHANCNNFNIIIIIIITQITLIITIIAWLIIIIIVNRNFWFNVDFAAWLLHARSPALTNNVVLQTEAANCVTFDHYYHYSLLL